MYDKSEREKGGVGGGGVYCSFESTKNLNCN